MPEEYLKIAAEEGAERAVTDYVAGMTDHYAVTVFSNIYYPKAWCDLKNKCEEAVL